MDDTALAVKTASRDLHVRITAKVLHRALASTLWRNHGDKALRPFWRGVETLLPKWVYITDSGTVEEYVYKDCREPVPQHPKPPPVETLSRLLDVTRLFLGWGAKAPVRGTIALKGAAAVGSVEIVNLLLDHGATPHDEYAYETESDSDNEDSDGDNGEGSEGDDEDSEGEDEDSEGDDEDWDGFGGIYRANNPEDYDIEEYIRSRTDPFWRDTLWLAVYYGHHTVAALLLDRGANIQDVHYEVFEELAFVGMAEMLDTLLPWISRSGRHYNALLRKAVSSGNIDVVRVLFDRGARMGRDEDSEGDDEDSEDDDEDSEGDDEDSEGDDWEIESDAEYCDGGILLDDAVDGGYPDIVELLLEEGAPIALDYVRKAATRGHRDIFNILLRHSRTQLREWVSTSDVVLLAVERGWDDVVSFLLGVFPGLKVNHLLDNAVLSQSVTTLKHLIAHGAEPSESGDALYAAVKYGYKDMLQILLDHGGNPWPSLLARAVAARSDRSSIIRMLLDAGVSPHDKVIKTAVKDGKVNDFRAFYEKGIDRPFVLTQAAKAGHLGIVEIAAQTASQKRLDGALELAVAHHHVDVVRFLLEKGANAKKISKAAVRDAELRAELGADGKELWDLVRTYV